MSASAVGKKGAIGTQAGSVGLSDTEVGKRNATTNVSIGRIGLSASETGKRNATTSVSIGSLGLSASVSGSAPASASGSASGFVGLSAAALGIASVPAVIQPPVGGGGWINVLWWNRYKTFVKEIFTWPKQKNADGRAFGSSGLSGSSSGIATQVALRLTLAEERILRKALLRSVKIVASSGTARGSLSIIASARGIGIVSKQPKLPLLEPIVPAPVVPAPTEPPPPRGLEQTVALVRVGSSKGTFSIVGGASGVGRVPEPEPEETEEELAMIFGIAA